MTFLGLGENQILELLWFMGVFAIAAMSLNLVVGQAGLFQLGQVGFFAIGGMATVFATHAGYLALDFFFGIVLGALMAAAAAVLLGLPTLRLRGDYFAIATLGFGAGVHVILKVTFAQGVFDVPPVNVLGWQAPNEMSILGVHLSWRYFELLVVFALVVLTYVLLERVAKSPFGRTLRAVREDTLAAQALGKDASAIRLKAFVLSAMLAAVAGSLFVHHLRVFTPLSYDFRLTIIMLVMVILGGLGSNQGAVVGAVIITVLNEVAKTVTGIVPPQYDGAALNIMLFAALLVVLMLVRPQGLLGDKSFTFRELLASLRRGGGGGKGGHGPDTRGDSGEGPAGGAGNGPTGGAGSGPTGGRGDNQPAEGGGVRMGHVRGHPANGGGRGRTGARHEGRAEERSPLDSSLNKGGAERHHAGEGTG